MENQNIRQPPILKPRFYYGYVIVTAAFLVMLVSWAVINSYGVFFKPLQTEFRWSAAEISGPFSICMIVNGILGIAVGMFNDKFGPRIVITTCGIIMGLGFLLMSQVNFLWQLYLFAGVLVGTGMAGIWVPQMSTVARWFAKRRSLMTGIVIAGVGISQMIGPVIIVRLIQNYDWRFTYLILGGAVLVVVVAAAQFMKRDPGRTGQKLDGGEEDREPSLAPRANLFTLREAIRSFRFWITAAIFFCFGYCAFSILIHLVPHVIHLGIPAVTAANVLATMGIVSIFGTYILGILGDRIGTQYVFAIAFFLIMSTLFWLLTAREEWTLYALAALAGISVGGEGSVESPLVAALFGLKFHGLIYGILHVGFTVGAAIGPFLTGYLFDITGEYQAGFLVGGLLGVVGLILALILKFLGSSASKNSGLASNCYS